MRYHDNPYSVGEKPAMSRSDKQAVNAIHQLLMDRFPKAFPKDYDRIIPLKIGIDAELAQRLPEVNPTLLRRALANHTSRAGYLLAVLHHRGDRRYNVDGEPVGTVTPEERAHAAQRLNTSVQRSQAKAERVRLHKEREEKRRAQRELERLNREAKAARKAEHERIQQEIAARKAALAAQGIVVESRSERKRRLAREAAERTEARANSRSRPGSEQRSRQNTPPISTPPRLTPTFQPERSPDRTEPAPARPMPQVAFKKKRRVVPPDEKGPA